MPMVLNMLIMILFIGKEYRKWQVNMIYTELMLE